jgi:hypothetical protein
VAREWRESAPALADTAGAGNERQEIPGLSGLAEAPPAALGWAEGGGTPSLRSLAGLREYLATVRTVAVDGAVYELEENRE